MTAPNAAALDEGADDKIRLLIVDDDDVVAEAVQRSVRKHGLNIPVVVAEDGQEALDVLRGKAREHKLSKPHVILLDLNMPRMNGFEFLTELRRDSALSESVVFVLTTSDSEIDKTRAHQEHVAGHMVKSSIGPQFCKLVKLLDDYREAVELP